MDALLSGSYNPLGTSIHLAIGTRALSKISPRKLKGFQDYHPETMGLRLAIIDVVRRQAELAGFNPIDTPALEYSEVLLGVGGETDKQVYRFLDNGERDVALRFDLTVPFARFVAENYGALPLPFKRVQMGPVWRAEKPQKGRFREFWQCDLDIIGVNSLAADSEILLCLYSIVGQLPCGPFTMMVGHRGILSELIRQTLGPLAPEQLGQALIAIDKVAKIGAEAVVVQLMALEGSDPEGARRLISLLAHSPGEGTSLEPLRELLSSTPAALVELEQLQQTLAIVREASNLAQGSLCLDLAIARGLGYYTGIVFETVLTQKPEWGSICSGGRYNHLVDRFLHQEVPGVGGSIGLDRLVAALADAAGEKSKSPGGQRAFIAIASPNAYPWGFFLAQQLRQEGVACDIALKEQKLVQQFKFANRQGYPAVIIVGDEEAHGKTASLKNMQLGHESKHLPWRELAARSKEIIHGSSPSPSPTRSPGP